MNPIWILPIIGTVILVAVVALGLFFEMGEYEGSDLFNTTEDED
jgi:hypothetical protein